MTDRLAIERRTCEELQRGLGDVQVEEMQTQKQTKSVEADLKESLPNLGYDCDLADHCNANVVALPKPGK